MIIDQHIPVPKGRRRPGSKLDNLRNIYLSMKVGDSFMSEPGDYYQIYHLAARDAGVVVTMRKQFKKDQFIGWRIWRIK